MTAYRSNEQALRLRLDHLDSDLELLARDERSLASELTEALREAYAVESRLTEAGPGGGPRSAARDRVGTAAVLLAFVGVPLVALHVVWHGYLQSELDVIPAILLLGVPGGLAALIAWPYHHESESCRIGFGVGVFFALAALLHVFIGRYA